MTVNLTQLGVACNSVEAGTVRDAPQSSTVAATGIAFADDAILEGILRPRRQPSFTYGRPAERSIVRRIQTERPPS